MCRHVCGRDGVSTARRVGRDVEGRARARSGAAGDVGGAETANEELQSTNEELETTNEELQSTNEELETINEELQSTNEELETINDELRDRTDELNELTAFMESILSSLRAGVAVLDLDLRVQAWNGYAANLWGLRSDEVQSMPFLNLDIGLPPGAAGDAPPRHASRRRLARSIVLEAVNEARKADRVHGQLHQADDARAEAERGSRGDGG